MAAVAAVAFVGCKGAHIMHGRTAHSMRWCVGSAQHAMFSDSAQHAMVCGERTACDVLGQVLELGRAEQDPVLFPPAEPRWQVVAGGERW